MATTETASCLERVGSAPISWGICEVPNWGHQLPVERVLGEMRELGLPGTELGSAGYLPTDPSVLNELLADHGLALTGGFVPLALHDPELLDAAIEQADAAAELLARAGADHFVCCLVADPTNWIRPELTEEQWTTLYANLEMIRDRVAERGLRLVVHAHVDSLVETAEEMERVLANTDTDWVLETGHLHIGGFDPLRFARDHRHRIGLVHLKDVNSALVEDLNNDSITLMQAVQAGIFPPLGQGDVPLAEIISVLENAGYDGWYVIEQDIAITGEFPGEGEGPVRDVAESIAFLRSVDELLRTDN